jgi:hypothetical protein
LDPITFTFSENSKYWRESLIEVNIAWWCQQTFCFQKFVINAQQCFAFTPQANFPTHELNFYLVQKFAQGEGDRITTRLPFKIFSTLSWIFSPIGFTYYKGQKISALKV